MLKNFTFSEAERIDLTEAYVIYFVSKGSFTEDEADLFERLTGGRTVDESLQETDSKKEDLCCLTLGAELKRADGELLYLTISPSIVEEDLVTDIDPCDITVDREEVIQWLKQYAEEHKDNGEIPSILAKIYEVA